MYATCIVVEPRREIFLNKVKTTTKTIVYVTFRDDLIDVLSLYHNVVKIFLKSHLICFAIAEFTIRWVLPWCCIKCPQNTQVKTLLQMYTAFTCRIYDEILLKVFDPRNRGNQLSKLQFFVL